VAERAATGAPAAAGAPPGADVVDAPGTLRERLLAAAAAHPDRVALAMPGREVTFAELAHTARVWAHGLVAAAGRRPGRVGIFAHRSEVAYTATLAAQCAGAAFVPFNPGHPAERLALMARVADLDAVIADARSAPALEAALASMPRRPAVVVPDAPAAGPAGGPALGAADLRALGPLAELPPLMLDDMAYLLFTSGTTGVPKGVCVTQANIAYFVELMTRRFAVTPDDRFSQTFDLTFDPSMFDLFVAWANGARVCGMSNLELLAPVRYVERNAITVWCSVPSIISLMRKKNFLRPGLFPSLRWSLFCGEPLPRAAAEAWQAAAPASTVENLYGPTELTVVCLGHRWDPATSPAECVGGNLPIGRPFAGNAALVVDEALRPTDGDGELCVAGPQAAAGYWRDAAKTAERFVDLPVADGVTKRFYRTGDLARRLPSGEYACLGRIDHQIKVLGRRVELGEIEEALRRHPGVVDAVALGWPTDEEGRVTGVAAFVTGAVDADAVRAAAREVLPEYMVPAELRAVDELPLNANGKIDRKALLALLDGPAAVTA
jgi:amino acid adenylation domain-containing protein